MKRNNTAAHHSATAIIIANVPPNLITGVVFLHRHLQRRVKQLGFAVASFPKASIGQPAKWSRDGGKI